MKYREAAGEVCGVPALPPPPVEVPAFEHRARRRKDQHSQREQEEREPRDGVAALVRQPHEFEKAVREQIHQGDVGDEDDDVQHHAAAEPGGNGCGFHAMLTLPVAARASAVKRPAPGITRAPIQLA